MKTHGWWVVAVLLAAGCGANNEVDGGGVDGDADADTDADADGDADVLSVPVRVYTQDAYGTAPAAGATVAFDLVGRSRVEQVADAEGRTTFDVTGWTGDEVGSFVAHLEGHMVFGRAALTRALVEDEIEADGALGLSIYDLGLPTDDLVEISGTASLGAATHMLTVSASVPATRHEAPGPDWSLEVPADTPFTLVVTEWILTSGGATQLRKTFVAWAVVTHEGVSVPTTIDIDMADAVEPVPFEMTAPVPVDTIGSVFDDAWSSLEVVAAYTAQTPASYLLVGGASLIDWGTVPGTCTYVGEYVPIDGVDEPLTYFGWHSAAGGTTKTSRPGLPVDGPQELAFSEPPIVTWSMPRESYRLGEVLDWTLSEADVAHPTLQPIVSFVRQGGPPSVMEIDMPPGTTSAVLPLPPSSVDAGELLGQGAVAYLQTCDYDEARWLCLRAGVAPAFGVQP